MIKSQVQEKQTTINRKLQSGNEIKALEEDKWMLENELQAHRDVARQSLQYYSEMKKKCTQQWEISEIEAKPSKTQALKHCFTLLLSTDFQMQKLLPYWGRSPQPGSTYYLQKLSYDLLGIVDHRCGSVHLRWESWPQSCWPDIFVHTPLPQVNRKVPSWVSRVHVFLDNAGSTNKINSWCQRG